MVRYALSKEYCKTLLRPRISDIKKISVSLVCVLLARRNLIPSPLQNLSKIVLIPSTSKDHKNIFKFSRILCLVCVDERGKAEGLEFIPSYKFFFQICIDLYLKSSVPFGWQAVTMTIWRSITVASGT